MQKEMNVTELMKEAAGTSAGWAVVMIVLGMLALLLPMATGVGVSVAFGCLVVLAGCTYIASAFATRGAGAFLWRLLVGVCYILGGGYLAFHPTLALASLTLALALLLLMEGALELAGFFTLHKLPGSGWLLFDSLVTLLLAYLIFRPWPSSSVWAIGTLLGVNLLMSGFTRLMYSLMARKAITALA